MGVRDGDGTRGAPYCGQPNACSRNRIIVYSVAIHFRLTIPIDPCLYCKCMPLVFRLSLFHPLSFSFRSISFDDVEMDWCKSYKRYKTHHAQLCVYVLSEAYTAGMHLLQFPMDQNYMVDKVNSSMTVRSSDVCVCVCVVTIE